MISQCAYCTQSTSGAHEFNCPLNRQSNIVPTVLLMPADRDALEVVGYSCEVHTARAQDAGCRQVGGCVALVRLTDAQAAVEVARQDERQKVVTAIDKAIDAAIAALRAEK